MTPLRLRLVMVVVALWVGVARGEGRVAVVVGERAPQLERFAAEELCGYLGRLFGVEVRPTTEMPRGVDAMFLVGSPETNGLIGKVRFGKVSDQGVVIRSQENGAVIVGGGSPRATLWAVYGLAERWGVRYLLHGDVLPEKRKFEVPSVDVAEEPELPVRQWRVLNEHAMGPISWGLADYRPVLDQLAKMRFNRVLLYVWPGQPFLPLEYRGIRQTSGTLFFGNRYPITGDMIGRGLFGGEKEYWNPDLPLPGGDPAKMTEAAVRHVRGIMEYAHARGMECVMSASLTEFPKEFRPVIEHAHPVEMVGTPTVGPGAGADVEDPELVGLARAVLETTVRTYPGVDYVALDLPEWREWVGQYERAWRALDQKYGVAKVRSLEGILEAAGKRADYPGGAERAVKEVKADIVALYFYDKVISDRAVKVGTQKFVMSTVAEELFPMVAKVLPAGSETMNFVDYTPSRVVKRKEALKGIPAAEIPSVLIYTLHDDNVGVLPQLATHSLAELTREIRGLKWAGFSTRYWLIGDHDPCVAYIARAAWDAGVTPEGVGRDLMGRLCGEGAVEDMLEVFREVEAATVVLEWHGLGLTFTTPGMMMQHWKAGEMPAELKEVGVHYQKGLEAARRALGKARPEGKNYVEYWVGRLEFGIDYMEAIEAVRAAATAEATKNEAGTLKEAERALELVTRGIRAYAGVAGDRSDKGAIAVMNEYAVRPLRKKVEELRGRVGPAVVATGFRSEKVYQSKQRPSYTSWVSFFPGNKGEWYLGCEEVTTPEAAPRRASTQFVYEMSLPRGYDKSKYKMELVLMKSGDGMKSWDVVSREPVMASGGSFAQARTTDGRFLRFVWACYSMEPGAKPNEIFYESGDEGKTWKKMPPFVSERFAWYPHRLRTLRDGTLVLCAPRASKWGKGTEYPIRAAMRLDTVSDMEMMLFFSRDQGKSWSNPLPILSGQNVSETDFVELPSGDLLFFNNSIFARPGRQFVYREGDRFTPGPLERVHSGVVPETVCLTEEGVLVGCHRPGTYYYSTDLGQNWKALEGVPVTNEVYQPWIQSLGNGRVACAGHLGADDPIGGRDQYVSLHTFEVKALRKTMSAKLGIERGFEEGTKRFLNSYVITLSAGGAPLPGKEVQVWYVGRDRPGYDSWNSKPLEERMKMGGKVITVRTDAQGKAKVELPEFDGVADVHASYQMVVRFNADGKEAGFNPAELPQLEFYANSGLDP